MCPRDEGPFKRVRTSLGLTIQNEDLQGPERKKGADGATP
jgi:hypothetical protein